MLDEVEHGLHRHLVVAADRKVVLSFALSGSFEDQCRNPAREKRCLVSIAFLLGGIEPDRHCENGGLIDADRLAQDPGEGLALIGDLDTFAGWPEIGKRGLPAFDLLLVRGLHLRLVVHEQE